MKIPLDKRSRPRADEPPAAEPSKLDLLPGGFVAQRTREDNDRESLFGMLSSYLNILLRRKLIVVLVLAITVGAGYFWLQQQTPIYRASAKVIINYDPPKVLQVRDVVELGSPKEYRGQLAYFETQYRIIKSNLVAEMVLNRENLWNDPHLLGFDRRPDMTQAEKDLVIATLHQPTLLANLVQVRPVPNSMLVQIDYDDPDPKFAQRIVNAVALAYMDQNVRYKDKIVENATRDLEKSAEQKRADVAAALQARIAFERQHNMGSVDVSKESIDERMRKLESNLTEARGERLALEARWSGLSQYGKGSDPFKVRAKDILDSDVIRLLKTQIATIESELAGLETKYLDKHPDVVAKQQELNKLRSIARQEVENLAQSVRNQLSQKTQVEEGITAELVKAREEQGRISILALEYTRLKETEQQVKDTEEVIAKRLSEMKESAKFDANNVRVLDEAILPTLPISPRRMMVLAIAVMIGLVLAIGTALLVDYADATIKDWKDVEDRLGHKVLGVVPVIGPRGNRQMTPEERRERDLYIHQNPTSNAAEASRSLRTNLLFMSTARKLETLLITSASPSEGKSMMAAHVATSVAASGSRVLLVEADMRRPRLAGSFKVSQTTGLSSALVGTEAIGRYVQKTEVANLDLLPCGPVPPNPAELLYTTRFAELLEEMKRNYDTVIFDSPPILPVSDGLVLAQQLDGVLVVVRAGQTSRHALRHALRSLTNVEAPILGMVLNYQTHKKGGGYGYSYGYGYGYGYRGKDAEAPS